MAVVFSVGMFAAWGIPANMATDGEFFSLGIGKHVVGRSVKAMEGHGGVGWGYFLTLPLYVPVAVFAIVASKWIDAAVVGVLQHAS